VITTVSVPVVIASRDRRETLLRTLAHHAELPERPPLIVVDNGSSDGTADAVRARHPSVRVVEARENLGAGARTLGARYAQSPFVAFSDDDSWWAPGSLGRAAALLSANPRVALIAARILVGPAGHLDPTCLQMSRSPLPRDPALPGPAVLGFVACGAVVRRSAFLSVGGFESRLQVGGEETLLSLDLAAAGWSLVYCDEVVAHHHPPGGDRPARRRRELRNALWTAWLRRPVPSALARTAALLGSAGPQGAAPFLSAVRGLPWVARQRRVLPPQTELALRTIEHS
jgi:GT2 family glycosyltransferase